MVSVCSHIYCSECFGAELSKAGQGAAGELPWLDVGWRWVAQRGGADCDGLMDILTCVFSALGRHAFLKCTGCRP